jgi:hypothetical protein
MYVSYGVASDVWLNRKKKEGSRNSDRVSNRAQRQRKLKNNAPSSS